MHAPHLFFSVNPCTLEKFEQWCHRYMSVGSFTTSEYFFPMEGKDFIFLGNEIIFLNFFCLANNSNFFSCIIFTVASS